jgi:hypothetical protein
VITVFSVRDYTDSCRDVTVEDELPLTDQYGVKATTRYGLGILRSTARAKITNIKMNI